MVVARKYWRRCALAAALILGAACSSDDDADPSTTATPATATTDQPADTGPTVPATTGPSATTVAPATTSTLPVDTGELGGLDAALTPQGTIELDAALELVAAGYSPVPGVTPAAAPLVDGGPVLRAAVASFADLTAEQQTAVAAIVAPPGTPLADAAASSSPLAAAAAVIAAQSLTAFGWTPDQVPISILELPYDAGSGTHNFSSPHALATGVIVREEDVPDCRLRVDTAATPTDPSFVAAVARETFHCGQYANLAPEAAAALPAWVVEGAASYAADSVAGATPVTAAAWQRWIGQPQRPLLARTADAVGFFSLVDETADPFAFAAALLGDPSVDSVRRRLEPTDLFDRWGREYAMQPDWEGGFAFTAAGAAGLQAPRTPVTLSVDGPPAVLGGQGDLSATPYSISVPGDVLVVTTSPGDRGAIRFANGQAGLLAQATQSVCLLPSGCQCPGVAADALNVSDAGGPDLFVGIGPSSGTGPTLAARSLPRWCQEVAVPAPADAVDPCVVGTWRTASYVAPEAPGVVQTVTGGEGGTVTFGADRTVSIDLGTMTPVVIAATSATGARSTTTLTYRGSGAGTWRADGGVLEVAGVDTSTFGITVRVEGTDGGVLGDADLAATDVRGAFYGTILGTARYACTPVSLSLTHVLPGLGATAGFELTPT
jgi:hypothetical protein